MVTLTALWLPILLSAVAVFLVSSAIHMASPWHKGDYRRLQNEDAVTGALRPLALPPGDYMIPRPSSMTEMRTPEFAEKLRQGPVLIMTVLPNGPSSMPRSLGLWFLYLLVVDGLAAHVAGSVLPPGADHRYVFHTVALTSFAGYALALWQMSIWYRRGWTITAKATVDGLIYALLTAVIFGWFWPR